MGMIPPALGSYILQNCQRFEADDTHMIFKTDLVSSSPSVMKGRELTAP